MVAININSPSKDASPADALFSLLATVFSWGGVQLVGSTRPNVQRALQGAAGVHDGVQVWKEHLLSAAGLGGLIAASGGTLYAALRPAGPGVCDHNRRERVVNVLTSLPYVHCGVTSLRYEAEGGVPGH